MKKPDAAVAAINYAITCDEPEVFLRLWRDGEFDSIRRDWEDVPEAVFIGADPTITVTFDVSGSQETARIIAELQAEISKLQAELSVFDIAQECLDADREDEDLPR